MKKILIALILAIPVILDPSPSPKVNQINLDYSNPLAQTAYASIAYDQNVVAEPGLLAGSESDAVTVGFDPNANESGFILPLILSMSSAVHAPKLGLFTT